MKRRLAITWLGVWLIGPAVFAQQGLRDRDQSLTTARGIASDLRRARMHAGPFYLLSSLEFSDIGYDEQFFVPTTEQSSGLSFGVSAPQRLYFVPTKKTVYSLEVKPEYAFFSKGGTHGQGGYTGRADAQFLFNHLYLDVFGSRSKRLSPYSGEIDRIVTAEQATEGITGEFKYSSRSSLTFKATNHHLEHPSGDYQPKDVPVNLLDRKDRAYRTAFTHKTFPLTSLSLIAERSNYSFDRTSFKNSTRTFVGAGINYDNGRTSVGLEAGPARLDFRDRTQHDFHGAVGNIRYTRRGVSWALTSAAMRDTDFSIIASNNFYILDRVNLLLEYAANKRLTLRFSESAGYDSYQTPARDPDFILRRRHDTISFTSVGWMYALHKLRGGFDVGYYKRTSNFTVESQDGIRFVLHLSLTP